MSVKLFILTLFLCNISFASVWVAKNEWSTEYEKKYSSWIQSEVTPDIFLKNNIATDCADVLVALRSIFARDHLLPVAFNNGAGGLITNEDAVFKDSQLSTPWQSDINFKKFLQTVMTVTNTRTLARDAYPIEINTESVRAGVFYINKFEDSGHIDLVKSVELGGDRIPMQMISSTVPIEVRQLFEYPFYQPLFPTRGQTGLMRLRWPIKTSAKISLKSAELMPYYSNEQYEAQDVNKKITFDTWLNTKILNYNLNPDVKAYELLRTVFERFEKRIDIVNEGFKACAPSKCSEKSALYNDHSTPSRDNNILFLLRLVDMVINYESYGEYAQTVKTVYFEFLNTTVKINEQKELSFKELVSIWYEMKYSSNPNDSVDKRWGQSLN